MQYSLTDIESLQGKLAFIMGIAGFVYAILYLLMTIAIPYNLTIRKQKDVFFRRVLFFVGLISLFSVNYLVFGDFMIAGWEPMMDPDYSINIKGELITFVIISTIISVSIYILTFWLVAKFLRGIFGYKPWTVFVSKGKKFGLF
jgi:hypothetical protein